MKKIELDCFLHLIPDFDVAGSHAEQRATFEQAGWLYEGGGHFSIVMSHPDFPGVVLKIGQQHDGWFDYAHFAKKSRSKHAPRIHHIDTDRWIAVMERLEPWMYSDKVDDSTKADMTTTTGRNWRNPRFFGRGSLKAFARRIADEFEGTWKFDIHSDNVMLRTSDMSFVITDPLSFAV